MVQVSKLGEEINTTKCPRPDNVSKGSEEAKSTAERSTSEQSGDLRPNPTPEVPHPKQDYIHVRARRGQATDSHSLAERVS